MPIKRKIEPLRSREQTAAMIFESAEYYRDLGDYLDSSLQQFFDFVRQIPYREDPSDMEVVMRPKYMLYGNGSLQLAGLDCKKKSILIGAWLNAHGIPWRLLAVSERPDKQIHHVFVQAKIEGQWRNIDPTLSSYKLFEAKPLVTDGEILTND